MIFNWTVACTTMMFLAIGQVLMKLLSSEIGRTTLTFHGLFNNFLPLAKLLLGLVATYAVVFALWMFVLQRMDLSQAFPFAGLTFVFVPLLSVAVLGEQISGGVIVGAMLIIAGIVISSLF